MASGTPLGSMFIELGLDTTNFAPKLQSAKREVNYFKAETRALDSALKGNGNNLSLLGTKYKSIEQQMNAQKKVLTQLKANYDNLEPGTAKWEAAAVQIERENAKLAAMESQLDQVTGAIKRVNSENSHWGRMSKELDAISGKLKTAGARFDKFADATKGVSLATSAGFAYATKKAVDFEGQMTTVKSLLRDTTSNADELNAQTKLLGDNSKKWSKQYGISTSSINTGMQELVKAGYDTNQTMSAMPAILDASRASGDDFNTVMEATTSIISQYNLKAKDAQKVTDSLTFVANKTKAGFSDMGNAMEYVGPVAKSVGMNVQETAAAVGILSNAGIKGEKAGTALRGALTRLLKPSKSNAAAMKELGFSAEEFRKGQIDLPDIIDRIKESTEGMTDAEKASLIAKAFGTEAQTGMNALIGQGSEELRKLTDETDNATGYTKKLADEMSGSGKAKLDKFKSSLEVLGITIGQKLLPTLTPIIENLTKLVDNFSEADPATQQFILGLGGILAVASPTSKTLGALSKGGNAVAGVLSKMAGKKAAAAAVADLGTSAVGATAGVGGLATEGGLLAGLMTPGGALVLGLLAAGGALAYFGGKALEAHQRTQEWGTKVSETEAKELSSFKAKVNETNKAMTDFGATSKGVDDVKNAFQALVTEIDKLQNKDLRKKVNAAEALGLSKETTEEIIQSSEQTVANAQTMSDEVLNIYKNASEQHRQLTAEEKTIVAQNQNELINTQLSLMKFSSKERIAITKAMNGEIDQLNNKQLQSALATTEKWIKSENKSYKTQKQALKDMYAEIKGTDKDAVKARKEIHDNIETLEAGHQAKMDAYGKKYAKIRKKLIEDDLKTMDPSQRAIYTDMVEKQMKKLGLSYDELMSKSDKNVSKIVKDNSLWAKTTKESSNEQVLANKVWKGLTFDEKTGKFKSNAKEEIKKALDAKGGWDNMKFIAKNANLSSNARLTMAEVLVESGKWDTLTPEEKNLIVKNHDGLKAIADSKTNMSIWNSMPEKVKKILGNNKDFINKKDVATKTLQSWDKLTPKEKKLLAKNMTAKDVDAAQRKINGMKGKTVTITSIFKNIYEKITKNEKGTNFHPGGLAMVNDQKGPLYKELVTLPNGQSFIPEGRDVILPLPRGSKVMKASITRDFMESLGIPRYANGIGIPENSKFIKDITGFSSSNNSSFVYDDSKTISILREILFAIRSSSGKSETGDVYMNAEKVGAFVKKYISDSETQSKRLRGELT